MDDPRQRRDGLDTEVVQGHTRDTAQAQKHWSPKVVVKDAPEIPERSDPGPIDSERSKTRSHVERTSQNPKGKVLR